MAADLRAARAGILEQVREPLPGARFADGAMTAFARAVGFDGYCLFAVDPLTGLRTMMFSRHGLQVPTARLVHNETVEHDVNRYADLIASPRKVGILALGGPSEPKSPRLHEILGPEGYRSELRLVLVSAGRYWGGLSLFRDNARFPFNDRLADLAKELCEPLSLAIRRYHVGHLGPLPAPRPAGTVLFDRKGDVLHFSDEARAWLVAMADNSAGGTTEDDLTRIVHEVAAAASGRSTNPPLCRVRAPGGEWLVVSGTRVDVGEVDVVVVLRAGDVSTIAPAFGAWCGLTPKECEVVTLAASGLGAKQMARQLSLSVLTVNDHLKSIYRKADVRGRDELLSLLS
jgi:DNA-binding CsgD family transcriptional regulator